MTLFFTDISLLILHDVYATFEKIEKINNFEKRTFFFGKISRLVYFEKFHGNLLSRIADFRKLQNPQNFLPANISTLKLCSNRIAFLPP